MMHMEVQTDFCLSLYMELNPVPTPLEIVKKYKSLRVPKAEKKTPSPTLSRYTTGGNPTQARLPAGGWHTE